MLSFPRILASASLVILVGACGSDAAPEATTEGAAADEITDAEHFFHGDEVFGAPPANDFALTDQHGETVKLSDHRGSVVLLSFGFIQCPDVCPATLSTWSRVQAELGEDASRVRFLFVTVDPERDGPAELGRHLSVFGKGFVGLTGTLEELDVAYRAFDVTRQKVPLFESETGYVVDHTSSTFLIDPSGAVRLTFDFDSSPDDVFADVRWILDHGSAASQLDVRDVWSRPSAAGDAERRETLPASAVGVVYLSITNTGDADRRLLSARSDACRTVELHETKITDGRARMVHAEGGIVLPARSTTLLEPGGLHAMLIGLTRDLVAGDLFDVELTFEDGETLTVESEVRAP